VPIEPQSPIALKPYRSLPGRRLTAPAGCWSPQEANRAKERAALRTSAPRSPRWMVLDAG
jgi:hypothetical protein